MNDYRERLIYIGAPQEVSDVDKLLKEGYRIDNMVPFVKGWLVTVCKGQRPLDFVDNSEQWRNGNNSWEDN